MGQTSQAVGMLRSMPPPASRASVPPNTQNYPIVKPNQTGLVKNKIYYSPKIGPVKYTGTGFVPYP